MIIFMSLIEKSLDDRNQNLQFLFYSSEGKNE